MSGRVHMCHYFDISRMLFLITLIKASRVPLNILAPWSSEKEWSMSWQCDFFFLTASLLSSSWWLSSNIHILIQLSSKAKRVLQKWEQLFYIHMHHNNEDITRMKEEHKIHNKNGCLISVRKNPKCKLTKFSDYLWLSFYGGKEENIQ